MIIKLKIKNYKLKIPNKRAGMTLFIAVVVMGVMLFISFAVVNIALKGTIFATYGRDSQQAFYAADAGIECALYWDAKPATSAFDIATAGTITCAGNPAISTGSQNPIYGTSTASFIGGGGVSNRTSRFGLRFNLVGINPVDSCAIVTVTKNADGTTYIKSRGYNTCDTSNLRRVERGLEVTY